MLGIVVTRMVALTLLVCCQRQGKAHSWENKSLGLRWDEELKIRCLTMQYLAVYLLSFNTHQHICNVLKA